MSAPFDLGYQNPVTTVQINTGFVGAAQAQAAAIATAADRAQTGADRTQTELDRVATGNDTASTAADRVQTGADRVQTGLDRLATGSDATSTAADRIAVAADRAQADNDASATAADRVQTSADRVTTTSNAAATAADRTQTGLDAAATAADRVQTALDVVQTGADRIQTGQDVVTSNTNAALAASNSLTATAQAALAATYASSAASVVQQDLSAITGQALHRSPNAIVAQTIYDVSRDSDGGAWVDRVTNTSWFNEALNGTWLYGPYSGFSSEMDARDWLGTQGQTSVITGDSSTFTNGVGAWTPFGTSTATAVNGRLRITLTAALGNIAGASIPVTTVAGQRYRIDLTLTSPNSNANTFVSAGTAAGNTSLGNLNALATMGSKTLSFVATGTTTYVNVSGSNVWPQNSYCEIDNITCAPVNLSANTSGAFYQDSTTGRFQRLWKNLLSYSDDATQVAPFHVVITTNAIAAPDGSLRADKLAADTTANTQHWINKPFTAVAGQPCTYTIYAKAGELNTFTSFLSGNVGGLSVGWNLGTLVAAPTAGTTASIVADPRGNGWYICTWTFTPTASASGTIYLCQLTNAGLGTYTGDGVSGLYVVDWQLEYGSAATGFESKAGIADNGQTETFRGNTARFPRLSAIVAEGQNVTIYDLTQPGRPMWMRFIVNGNNSVFFPGGGYGFGSLAAGQGRVCVGSASGTGVGIQWADLVADKGYCASALLYNGVFAGNISQRNQGLGRVPGTNTSSLTIVSGNVNSVAMTVLPDAPLDPFTGLQVPTMAVGTASGLSVIHNSGTVVSSASTTNFTTVAITPRLLQASSSGNPNLFTASNPGALGVSFALTTTNILGVSTGWTGMTSADRTNVVRRNGARIDRVLFSEGNPGASLAATIADAYNTGWMIGDIRRCWLSSSVAESISGTELVANGTFNTDLTGWTQQAASGGGIAWSSGSIALIGGASSLGGGYQDLTLVPGRTYRISGTTSADSLLIVYPGTSFSGGTLATLAAGGTGAGTVSLVFTAGAATQRIMGYANSNKAGTVDNISVQEVIADRSYKNKPLMINGTLTKALTGGLAMYSGWSATNYAQDAYSADLDFGTSAWSVSTWANAPTVLPTATFPLLGTTKIVNGTFADTSNWTITANCSEAASSGVLTVTATAASNGVQQQISGLVIGRRYAVTATLQGGTDGANMIVSDANTTANPKFGRTVTAGAGPTTSTDYFTATGTTHSIYLRTTNVTFPGTAMFSNISLTELASAPMFERSAATGPGIRFGITQDGRFTAQANDGATVREVFSPAAYNTATNVKVRVEYSTSGTLTLKMNGQAVATATGNPLLTLNNANAVTTIGNARTLDAAFPGSIALVKASAANPTQEQSTFMYEQEKFLFAPGAICTLPDSGAVVDMDHDAMMDRLKVVSAANESAWTGLVCTGTSPVPSGSFTKAAHRSGVKLLARSTTNPGVDVTIPAYGLREELFNRAERAATLSRITQAFDWVGGFTGTQQASPSALVTSVTGLSYPAQTTVVGATVTGTGVSGTVQSVVGTTVYLSNANTQAGSGNISFTDFILPVGYEAGDVYVNRSLQQEGATKDFTRLYDGFRETIRFAVAPGSTAWVRIDARRKA
jgi:hypothetical protein